MDKPTFIFEASLPLEIRGFEVNTAVGVFALTKALDANLELSLNAKGYVQRSGIVLSDGQIIDGWVKI
ncbi:MAG TPA: hypothetical protein VET88_00165 [Gammaproteobacteria bacterium]|nr:hypothetical protein [Gammaproteobacteria bacterium]